MIDEMNIYAATRDSMEQAVKGLTVNPDFVIADAMALAIDCPTESVIKGDAKSLAVAAASIIAKTTRDAIMDKLHNDFPMYNFKKNAGYGTAEHVLALQTHGPCEHHRTTFEPVKSMMEGKEGKPMSFPTVGIISQSGRQAQCSNRPLVLNEGQMFHGQIKQLFPGQMAEVQIGGQKCIAKLEVPMKAGDSYYFQVNAVKPELQLKIISGPLQATEGQARQLGGINGCNAIAKDTRNASCYLRLS